MCNPPPPPRHGLRACTHTHTHIGGNVLKVWDVFGGGRELRTLSNHQKTITSLCFDGSRSRFLTASLDHHVKIYSVSDYHVVHTIKYPAPLLAVALSVSCRAGRSRVLADAWASRGERATCPSWLVADRRAAAASCMGRYGEGRGGGGHAGACQPDDTHPVS